MNQTKPFVLTETNRLGVKAPLDRELQRLQNYFHWKLSPQTEIFLDFTLNSISRFILQSYKFINFKNFNARVQPSLSQTISRWFWRAIWGQCLTLLIYRQEELGFWTSNPKSIGRPDLLTEPPLWHYLDFFYANQILIRWQVTCLFSSKEKHNVFYFLFTFWYVLLSS